MSARQGQQECAAAGLISVVVATLNCRDTIDRCLASICGQSYQHREVIVIDGGSHDGTLERLAHWQPQLTRVISEPDEGLYQAWNKGVRAARGEWICFLGGDDVFHAPDALACLAGAAARTEAPVVYGRMNLVAASGAVAQTVGRPWKQAKRAFLQGFMIPHPGTLHHRNLFERYGAFDESYRTAGDYEFLLRALVERDAQFVESVVVDMSLHGMSARPDSIHDVLREVRRARRVHGLSDFPVRLHVALAASWAGARIHRFFGRRVFETLADAYRILRGKPRVWTVH